VSHRRTSGNWSTSIEPNLPHEILNYKVVRVLGRGGGSVVYEVREKKSFERFALKHIVRKNETQDLHAAQAHHEFEVASQFKHPNLRRAIEVKNRRAFAGIVGMFKLKKLFVDAEVVEVMELIDGQTLEQHPVDDMTQICRVLLEVANGLEAMHAQGWVHADLKPHNIMITPAGAVKIIDFGFACRDRTLPARVRGTPGFIAPEQVIRKHVTFQTDVFSFGATMYNMLTKRLVPTTLKARNLDAGKGIPELDSEKMPTPRQVNPAIPPALSGLVMDCIKPRPEQRPPSIKVVRERLLMASMQSKGQKVEMPGHGVSAPAAIPDEETDTKAAKPGKTSSKSRSKSSDKSRQPASDKPAQSEKTVKPAAPAPKGDSEDSGPLPELDELDAEPGEDDSDSPAPDADDDESAPASK